MSKDSFDSIYEQMQVDFNAVMLGFSVQKNAMDHIRTDVRNVKQSVHGLEQSVQGLRHSVHGVEKSVVDLRLSVGGLQTSVGSLETSVGSMETSVGDLKTSVGGLEKSVEELRDGSDLQERALKSIGRGVKKLTRSSASHFKALETRVQKVEKKQAG